MRKDLNGWALSFIDEHKHNKQMRSQLREQVCETLRQQGMQFEVMNETSLMAASITNHLDSAYGFSLDIGSMVLKGYEAFLVEEMAPEQKHRLYILDTNQIDPGNPYAEMDYELLTKQKLHDFYELFLMDAWEQERLKQFDITFAITDEVLYERFKAVIDRTHFRTPIRVVRFIEA